MFCFQEDNEGGESEEENPTDSGSTTQTAEPKQDNATSSTTLEKHNERSSHPSKKIRSTSQATETALKTASSVLDVVAKRLDTTMTAKAADNPTRLFCDMLYQQLMSIPEDERDMVQYELHGVVIGHKRMRQHTIVSTPSQHINMSTASSSDHRFGMSGKSSECSSMSSALSSVSQSLYEDNTDNQMMQQYYSL